MIKKKYRGSFEKKCRDNGFYYTKLQGHFSKMFATVDADQVDADVAPPGS